MTTARSVFRPSTGLRVALLLMALVAIFQVLVTPAAAHPLGNFSVNQYSKLEIETASVKLTYVLDLAELPTLANIQALDADGDGSLSATERDQLRDVLLGEISPALTLSTSDTMLPLTLQDAELQVQPGQANLDTTRLTAHFVAELPGAAQEASITYTNGYAAGRVGWREIVVVNGADVAIADAAKLSDDQSRALTTYPGDLLSSPLDEQSVAFTYHVAPGTPAASDGGVSVAGSPLDFGARLAGIVNGSVTSPTGLLLALLAAMLWGATHALSPGHGKTVVGAYLVGSRGTPLHALFLGLTVTITHTAGVVALGIVILLASRTVVPEMFYPWLSLISGLMVVLVGITILRQRVLGLQRAHHHHHEHDHGEADHHAHHYHDHGGFVHTHDGHTHSHLPPGSAGDRVTWRSLLALGISGGLLPCPSALLALLGAVALGRAGFGLAIVVAFSIGLAATLTGVGVLFLYAGRFLEQRRLPGMAAGLMRFAPAAAAVAVTASGALIVVKAVGDLW